jgi:SnoaL-like polyketide cyclase
MIKWGQFRLAKSLEAFEEFYDPSVQMQENLAAPCVGKDANRGRMQQFFGMVQTFHSCSLLGSAVSGKRTYSEWEFDITFMNGSRIKWAQVAVREWLDGKVVHERFYWDRSGYPFEV